MRLADLQRVVQQDGKTGDRKGRPYDSAAQTRRGSIVVVRVLPACKRAVVPFEMGGQ